MGPPEKRRRLSPVDGAAANKSLLSTAESVGAAANTSLLSTAANTSLQSSSVVAIASSSSIEEAVAEISPPVEVERLDEVPTVVSGAPVEKTSSSLPPCLVLPSNANVMVLPVATPPTEELEVDLPQTGMPKSPSSPASPLDSAKRLLRAEGAPGGGTSSLGLGSLGPGGGHSSGSRTGTTAPLIRIVPNASTHQQTQQLFPSSGGGTSRVPSSGGGTSRVPSTGGEGTGGTFAPPPRDAGAPNGETGAPFSPPPRHVSGPSAPVLAVAPISSSTSTAPGVVLMQRKHQFDWAYTGEIRMEVNHSRYKMGDIVQVTGGLLRYTATTKVTTEYVITSKGDMLPEFVMKGKKKKKKTHPVYCFVKWDLAAYSRGRAIALAEVEAVKREIGAAQGSGWWRWSAQGSGASVPNPSTWGGAAGGGQRAPIIRRSPHRDVKHRDAHSIRRTTS